MNFKDLKEQVLAHHNHMKQQVFIDDTLVVFTVAGEYCIELNRCDTPEKLLGWVHRLCEKAWVTPQILARFIELVTAAHQMELKYL